MRFILAGLAVLFLPTLVFAQATGEVQSIGFNGTYRPNCWTPMVVRLKPDSTESANYEIQVWQHDLDGDRPIYTRQIVLNGAPAKDQQFWMYFLPQPIEKGLPDQATGSLRDLQRDLQVYLCKPDHKPIAQLPITSTLSNVDPYRDSYNANPRSSKLILAVSANGSKQPTLSSYNKATGVLEDITVINVRPSDLPEDPIGYDAVDSIIWLDGDPATELNKGNLDTFAALKDYIRFGGHLVVCQSTTNWQEDANFGELMPVDVQGIGTRDDFEPLMSMAQPRLDPRDAFFSASESWSRTKGPYQMARAVARPGSVVETWITWKPDAANPALLPTPYLARKAFGLGEVTWVAQPLTTEAAPSNTTAWPYIWDKVLGLKTDSYVLADKQSPDDPAIKDRLNQFKPAGPTDLGYAMVQGLNLSSKANWLILLAIVFFIGYWIVAGPGTYLYLASKKKQGLSWEFFGIGALVATAVTVLVVKLVLRGPPEVRHLSFVRVAPNQPAIIHSRFGLYIPRDGDQKIELEPGIAGSVNYLSPFAEHPQQLGADVTEFPSPAEYYVPVRDMKSEGQPQITVAYRSSLKKFQARWVGDWSGRFSGSVSLDPEDYSLHLNGTLTNNTGIDLTDVYLAFAISNDKDWMIYIPTWAKGATYDIKHDLAKPFRVGKNNVLLGQPGENKILSDELAPRSSKNDPKLNGWENYFYSHFHRGSNAGDDPNLNSSDYQLIFPMLSVFDRLPPVPRTVQSNNNGQKEFADDRVELYNRGARMLNTSASIAAGQLVILSTAKGPIPIPLQVDDTKITGEGTVFYQFILPIDRGKMDQPTTQPAED